MTPPRRCRPSPAPTAARCRITPRTWRTGTAVPATRSPAPTTPVERGVRERRLLPARYLLGVPLRAACRDTPSAMPISPQLRPRARETATSSAILACATEAASTASARSRRSSVCSTRPSASRVSGSTSSAHLSNRSAISSSFWGAECFTSGWSTTARCDQLLAWPQLPAGWSTWHRVQNSRMSLDVVVGASSGTR